MILIFWRHEFANDLTVGKSLKKQSKVLLYLQFFEDSKRKLLTNEQDKTMSTIQSSPPNLSYTSVMFVQHLRSLEPKMVAPFRKNFLNSKKSPTIDEPTTNVNSQGFRATFPAQGVSYFLTKTKLVSNYCN